MNDGQYHGLDTNKAEPCRACVAIANAGWPGRCPAHTPPDKAEPCPTCGNPLTEPGIVPGCGRHGQRLGGTGVTPPADTPKKPSPLDLPEAAQTAIYEQAANDSAELMRAKTAPNSTGELEQQIHTIIRTVIEEVEGQATMLLDVQDMAVEDILALIRQHDTDMRDKLLEAVENSGIYPPDHWTNCKACGQRKHQHTCDQAAALFEQAINQIYGGE